MSGRAEGQTPGGAPPRTFRIGIVGAGGIARAHGAACRALDDVELRAVCDVSPAALAGFGEQFGVPSAQRYLDLDAMLAAESLDVAIICTWGVLHAETGIRLARSGRVAAILCEKPFTATAAEAERLVATAAEHGVLIAEAFKFRHHPLHLRAKAMIDGGEIGDVMAIRSTFCMSGDPATRDPAANWRWNRAKGGGSIYDLACYCIHHARFIFDAEPRRVFATTRQEREVDIAAAILLGFPGGRTAQLTVGYDSWHAHYAEIAGTTGMLRLDNVWNNEYQPVAIEHRSKGTTRILDVGATHQFTDQLRHLCDCLATGAPHRISPQNSIDQMRVVDAVFESLRSGLPVTLASRATVK